MPPPPSKRIVTYATSESLLDDLPPTQKHASMSTQKSLRQHPWETQRTLMPPDDSNSQGRRTDSHDELLWENVTTAERKDISQKNAPSPGKNEFHGEDHTGPRKPPSRKRPRKNRRETTVLKDYRLVIRIEMNDRSSISLNAV